MKSRWNPRKKGREAAGGWARPVGKLGGTEESVLRAAVNVGRLGC